MIKQQKGMTLLGLSFTILVMLSLAAIAIAMVLDGLRYDPEPVQVENNQVVVSTDNANQVTEETPVTNLNS